MMRHAFNLSGYRLTPVALALVAALAIAPAFAQTSPTTQSASPPNASMNEGRPAADTVSAPAPNTEATPTTTSTSQPKRATFEELDKNHDDKLTREEVAGDPLWSKDFDIADTNHDGFISKAEFKKHEADLKRTAQTEKDQNGQPASDQN